MEPSPWIPTLPELLKEYNARLGWTQVQFAYALGKDPSEVSKILNGKTARPHDETLELIVAAYRQAGLHVTIEQLQASRDAARNYPNPYNIPPHWLRLILRVMAEDHETQDLFFELWSHQYERITSLVECKRRLEE